MKELGTSGRSFNASTIDRFSYSSRLHLFVSFILVSNVASFRLPDPAGRAGGACTSTLLNVLYKDHHDTSKDLSFVEVLDKMREILKAKGFSQIPQVECYVPLL